MPVNINNGNELLLFGTVGDFGWEDEFFTAGEVVQALSRVGAKTDILVRMNSGGGNAFEGAAVHSALSRHKGQVDVLVEGIAASAASVICMAGGRVAMAAGSLMMVHEPAALTLGTASDHEAQVRMLNTTADAMAGLYATKSKLSVEDCKADMAKESWFTPESAVERGYADRVDDAEAAEVAPYAYQTYARAPQHIVALATARKWTGAPRKIAASATSATPPNPLIPATSQERKPMPATSFNRADAAEIVRLCNANQMPALAAILIAEGATLAEANARVDASGEVRTAVAMARRMNPSIPEDFGQGMTVADAKAALLDRLAAASEANPVASYHRAGSGSADHPGGSAGARAASKASMHAELKRRNIKPAA